MANIQQVFDDFKNITVAVLGDVMLDTYFWGDVDRISPEAPVPIVSVNREEYRLGGASNVALNLLALGAQVDLFSVIGEDRSAELFFQKMDDQQVSTGFILQDPERITTNKTRIMARNQQVMRLDKERTQDLTPATQQRLLAALTQYFEKKQPQLLILEDYNKGVLTPDIIQSVIKLAKKYQVVTAVDPKQKHFFAYENVDIFKPNFKEIKTALGYNDLTNTDLETLSEMHQQLHTRLNHGYSLFTLSEKGIFFQSGAGDAKRLPAKIRTVSDVSGAGDTVIAVISLAFALTGNMELAAELGNIAGGLVCEEVGTVAINKEKLLKEALQYL